MGDGGIELLVANLPACMVDGSGLHMYAAYGADEVFGSDLHGYGETGAFAGNSVDGLLLDENGANLCIGPLFCHGELDFFPLHCPGNFFIKTVVSGSLDLELPFHRSRCHAFFRRLHGARGTAEARIRKQ